MAITPYLLYQDVGAALKFLSKAFGLKKFGALYRSADGSINHASMRLGADLLMIAEDPEGHQWYFAQELPRRATKKKSRRRK